MRTNKGSHPHKQHLQQQQQHQQEEIIKYLGKVRGGGFERYTGEVRSIFEGLLAVPGQERTGKQLRKIRAELKQLHCFKVKHQQSLNINALVKRDHEMVMGLIAPFVELRRYRKGEVMEVTGLRRNRMRILLSGKVAIYEPMTSQSFKNCLKRVKEDKYKMDVIGKSHQIFQGGSKLLPIHKVSFQEEEFDEQNGQNLKEVVQSLHHIQPHKQLTKKQCKSLLQACGIITPLTAHQNTFDIIEKSEIIGSQSQRLFIEQKNLYRACAICMNECHTVEIDFEICKNIINLIQGDQEKPYVKALLTKFPMLDYYDAKQYVTQKYMLVNEKEKREESRRKGTNEEDSFEDEGEKQEENAQKTRAFIKEVKVVTIFHCEIKFTGSVYLIIQGKATIVIDLISERKTSVSSEYASSQKKTYPKELLILCSHDLFGFEELGKKKHANLRYIIQKGSKILKLNPKVIKQHYITIFGFENSFREIKQTRNQILAGLLGKMDENLQNQQIKRFENLNNQSISSPLVSFASTPKLPIKSVRYYGHSAFEDMENRLIEHFSPENKKVSKSSLSPEVVKDNGLGIEFSTQIMRRDSNSIKIKEEWIEMRNKNGKLMRKKRVRAEQHSSSGHEEVQDRILRKVGILNAKQIADHNMMMVLKRKSKYEFEDLEKEGKQFRRLREKAESLPKLTKYFAKKQDRIFTILHKKNHL